MTARRRHGPFTVSGTAATDELIALVEAQRAELADAIAQFGATSARIRELQAKQRAALEDRR